MANRATFPARPRGRRSGRVAATAEALQSRILLSVTPVMAARLEDAGYERMTWRGRDLYAEPGEWIVSLRGMRGSAAKQVADASATLRKLGRGLQVVSRLGSDGLFKVAAPGGISGDAMRAALRRVRNFEFVEPNAAVWAQGVFDQRDDPFYASQYALNNLGTGGGIDDADLDAPEAWAEMGDGAAEVVVGVIDTGVDYLHPDLAGSMWVNPFEIPGDGIDNDDNGFVDDVHGADFAGLDGDPLDEHGHGTHVAGIIAAGANNGVGVSGVAPNAKIMALQFLDASSGIGSTDGAIAALNYAAEMKARGINIRITNNSWGSVDGSAALDRAIRASGESGMLFVAAAGNGGVDEIGDDNDGAPFYPASSSEPNVISVAASDNRDLLGLLSNYGPTSVDLAAPGILVVGTIPGNGYGYMSGTSMASPHVAGVAALAFGRYPDATWHMVHSAILRGVDPVDSLSGTTVTGGRANAMGTLRAMAPAGVAGRYVFYNGSAFDGRSSAATAADEAAIATDKAALLPGETAGFANYTSYFRGINGVMVDLQNPAGTAGAGDFAFAVHTAAGQWTPAPAPASVTVRNGAPFRGTDRVTITWADGTIRDTWLRVTVLAGGATGLGGDDVFYFGNAIGETGNSDSDAAVTPADLTSTRAAQRSSPTTIESRYDFNRDGTVNAVDLLIVRGRQASPGLPLITAPDAAPPERMDAAATTEPVFSTTSITWTQRIATRRRSALLEL